MAYKVLFWPAVQSRVGKHPSVNLKILGTPELFFDILNACVELILLGLLCTAQQQLGQSEVWA